MNAAYREKLIQLLRPARKLVFFGGAGVSTESGIPDFRSADGLYHQKYDVPPEVMLSHSYFVGHPEKFYQFYRDKMNCTTAEPNAAHLTLARWEREGILTAVVTQNIDGLHQKAGSQAVYELHGSIHRNYCLRCGKTYGPEAIFDSTDPVPHCSCGGIIRPDVVLYEEGLDGFVLDGTLQALQEADALIVAGTSLTVYPAAGLLRYFQGDCLVLINRHETRIDKDVDLCIHEPVGEVLSEIAGLFAERDKL